MRGFYIFKGVDDRVNRYDSGSELVISDSDMEYIFNALREAQIQQQQLAGEYDGQQLAGEYDGQQGLGIDLGKDLFQEQYHEITDLRERLVQFVGYDMTDES